MRVGTSLISVGLLHLVVGVVLYAAQLQDIAHAGVIAAVGDFGDRAAAFWFVITALPLALLGVCTLDLERRGLKLPRALAPGLCVLGLAIVVPMPQSGGWLFFVTAWLAQRSRARLAQIDPSTLR
jgi:peptidoglycan/LPS O-acetylase OafA/YrhL